VVCERYRSKIVGFDFVSLILAIAEKGRSLEVERVIV
jgi:hypothetical protein